MAPDPWQERRTSAPKSSAQDRPEDTWIYIDVSPIIATSTFDEARTLLERNRRIVQRNGRGRRYLLQGLVVCSLCGYAFYGKPVSRASKEGKKIHYMYYRCVGCDGYRFEDGRVCSNQQVRVDQLDGHVWDSVRNLLMDPDQLMHEWVQRRKTGKGEPVLVQQRDLAEKSLSNQKRTQRRLVDAFEAGAIDLNELESRTRRVKLRIKETERLSKRRSRDWATSMNFVRS